MLGYSASSSDTTRVAVTVSGSVVTAAGVRAGEATVTVVATDPGGLTAEQSFAVRVPNRPPRPVGMIADRDVYVGDTIEIDVAAHFRDPDEDMLAYTAASLDASLVAVSVSGSAVMLTGMAVGSASVMVTATDPEGLAAGQVFTVTVPNRAPEPVGRVADQQVFVGDSVTVDVAANFAEPDGQELEYTVATANAAVVSVAVSGSAVTVAGVALGAAAVTVTAQDPGGMSAEQEFIVTVPNRAPEAVGGIGDREVRVDTFLTLDVADSFVEPDGEELEYSARSSDTTRVTVAVSGTVLTMRGVAAGHATVTVVAADPGGLTAEQNFGVRVPSRPPVAVGTIDDRVVPAGTTETVDVAEYFTDPDGDALDYFAHSSDTARVRTTELDQVVALHGVAGGTATVTVTARDPGGLTARQTFNVTVPNRAPRQVGVIENATVDVGSSVSVDVSAHFDDPDGDDLSYTGTSSNTAAASVGVSESTITVAAVSAGVATITATARDPGGLSAVQSFDVTVLQPNRAPIVVSQIGDLDALAGERYAAPLAGVFEDPDDDPLTYSTSSSNNGIAQPEILNDSVFVSAVGVGSATVSITATDPEGLSATETFGVTVEDHHSFDMWLAFTSSVTEAQRVRIGAARDAWESVVRWTELDDVAVSNPRCLGLVRRSAVTVDDHLAMVHVDSIDGPGGTLAFAGYCYFRRSDGTPIVSATWFDEADIGRVMELGMLGVVAFHEFAHGLGFSGVHWHAHGLLDRGEDPHFTGTLAIEAFDAAGGSGYPGAKVPISSPDYSHWREGVFGREGMTPALTLGVANPFSAITLQAMADVGYLVDASLADDYQLPGTVPPDIAADHAGRVFDLSDDVVQGPIMVLDSDGRVMRVIPAPPGSPAPSLGRHEVRIERRTPPGAPEVGLTPVPPARETMWSLVRPSPRRSPR